LLCGAIKWLKDNEQRIKRIVEDTNSGKIKLSTSVETLVDDSEPDWVMEHVRKQEKSKQIAHLEEQVEKTRKQREKLSKLRAKERANVTDAPKRKRLASPLEEDFCVDEYVSEEESEVKKLLKNRGILPNDDDSDEEPDKTKIFYCSRTHSQLAQVVGEVKKTKFGHDLMTVSLGSRKNLCVNPQVNSLKGIARINDKCMDLQKSKAKEGGCPWHQPSQSLAAYRDAALAKVQDIEDLVQLGKNTRTCPYYGTRNAIRSAELVMLPYNLLLQKSARDSLGINLKGHVIIIDEAHNLIDTITQIHSVSVDTLMVARARAQLQRYFEKYQDRLNSKNAEYISEILLLLRSMHAYMVTNAQDKNAHRMWKVNDFVAMLRVEHVNLFKLDRYMQESRIAQKLHGFVEKVAQTETETSDDVFVAKHVSALNLVHAFLMSLAQTDKDGRVICTIEAGSTLFKYLLLNPSDVFQQLTGEARCVIVAGGTMEPIADFQNQLFPNVAPKDVVKFQCGHVIPPTSLATFTLNQGPSNIPLDFTFENRNNVALLDEVGKVIGNLVNVVPDGLVIFFPSYSYMELVVKRWKSTGQLERIEKKKELFLEPRDANQLEQTLRLYSQSIATASSNAKNGAILVSVVGGKMSEGINFSDGLGRCVVMVGLPFANLTSVELKEKIEYLNSASPNSGQEYYENLCMRAVNQSIGRAIRHKQDYATIVLLDHRYSKERIKKKIPAWIRRGMVDCATFGNLIGSIGSFFRTRRTQSTPS